MRGGLTDMLLILQLAVILQLGTPLIVCGVAYLVMEPEF